MEDFIGRRDLLDPAELRALSARSDLRGLVQLGSHVLALGVPGVRGVVDNTVPMPMAYVAGI